MQQNCEKLRSEAIAAVSGLTLEETQMTPLGRPDKWSIQLIVEHLILSYQSSSSTIQRRLDKGTPTLAVPSRKQKFLQFVLLNLGLFPHGRSAPAFVVPVVSAPLSGDQLGQKIGFALEEMDRLTDRAEKLFGRSRSISHNVLGPLAMPQWLRFHLVHGRHHLKQIARIRREHKF